MVKKKSRGFGDLTKKVLAEKPENAPTSLADFQDGEGPETTELEGVQVIERQDVKASEPQSAKTLKRQSVKASKPSGEAEKNLDQRLTLYLSEEAFDSLENAWLRLRKLAKSGDRKRISKSLIIEEALLIALEEFEAKGEKSRLVKALKL